MVWCSLFLLATTLTGVAYSTPSSTQAWPSTNFTTYQVNLDDPPQQRFAAIAAAYKDEIGIVFQNLTVGIPGFVWDAVNTMAPTMVNQLGDYGQELIGISQACGLALGEVLLLNIQYDLTNACTSIVAMDENQNMLHVRNQDYATILRDVNILVEFYQNGTHTYSAVTFAGFTGIVTGYSSGFSFSENARSVEPTYDLWENLLEALLEGGVDPAWLTRQAFDRGLDFAAAKDFLSNGHIVAPAYYILAGTEANQGTVITRDRQGPANVWDVTESEWFVVQTNFDHWLPPPTSTQQGQSGDCRFTLANKLMNDLGQSQVSLAGMNDVILQVPVLNHFTLYSAIMSPGRFFQAYTRNCTNPYWCPN